MSVFACVCVSILVDEFVCRCMYNCVILCMCLYVCVCMCMYAYVNVLYVCIRLRMFVCAFVGVSLGLCTCCLFVCVCVCVYVRV